MGHHVLVGNPRKLRAIWNSENKGDDRDCEMLARIGRADPKLLHPIQHRSLEAHTDLVLLKARDMLVRTRTSIILHCRGIAKCLGFRFSKSSAPAFHKKLEQEIPDSLRDALEPMIAVLQRLTVEIRQYDKKIEALSSEKYTETQTLRQINGVGPVTALAYVLTLEEHSRFAKSRDVGPYLGLTPRRNQSGDTDKQLGITKAGNVYLRRLLVGSANYIIGQFGTDCDLQRFGLKLCARGGKNAKKRAAVAVARKLSVVMHHLWKHGDQYQPLRKIKQAA